MHKFRALGAGRMRIKWVPVFMDEGIEVRESGQIPLTEKVGVSRVLISRFEHGPGLPRESPGSLLFSTDLETSAFSRQIWAIAMARARVRASGRRQRAEQRQGAALP